jgi:hypothetical protein
MSSDGNGASTDGGAGFCVLVESADLVMATAPEAIVAAEVLAAPCPAAPEQPVRPTRPLLLAFDGRDVSDAAAPDEVLAFGLLTCAHCGTLRDARYPFCCEFAATAAL